MTHEKAEKLTLDVMNASAKVMKGCNYSEAIDIMANALLSLINCAAEESGESFQALADQTLEEMRQVVIDEVQSRNDYHPIAQA